MRITEGTGGTPFTPATAGGRTGTPATRVRPQPAFYFLFIPDRWGVIAGQVLPILGRMPFLGGVNNMRRLRGGAFSIGAAEAHAKNLGRTIIPLDSVPKKHQVDGYLYRPPGRPDVTLCYTDSVYPGSTAQDTDLKLWTEFLQHQIKTGVVSPCPAYVLERMLESIAKQHASAVKDARTLPTREPDVVRLKAEMDTISKALAARTRTPVAKRPAAPQVEAASGV